MISLTVLCYTFICFSHPCSRCIFREWEWGREREREGEKHPCVVASCPPAPTWPATQTCALTGSWTSNPLVHNPSVLNPLSHTSRGQRVLIGSITHMPLGSMQQNVMGWTWGRKRELLRLPKNREYTPERRGCPAAPTKFSQEGRWPEVVRASTCLRDPTTQTVK